VARPAVQRVLSMTVRSIGIVGCGLMGSHHAWALQQLRSAGLVEAELVLLHDLDPERAAALSAETGVSVADSLQALVEAVDVVWVTTWTAGHLEPCEVAASAGRAVFVEKPLAPDLATCEQLAAVLRPVLHQVGLVLRHAPAYRWLAEAVQSGRYGAPMGAFFRDDQRLPVGGTYGSDWRADATRSGGGTLVEHSVHDVDVLAWVLGEPVAVSARTSGFAGIPDVEDLASVRLDFADGASAGLLSVWHRVEGRASRRLEVHCTQGVLWMDEEVGPVHVQTGSGTEVVHVPFPRVLDGLPLAEVPDYWRNAAAGLALQAKAFLDGLEADKQGWPSVEEALVAHRTVDAAYRSAAAGGGLVRL